MENILFIGFAFSFLTLMSIHVYLTNAFFLQLKKAHKEMWNSLGQPRWKIHFGDQTFQEAMKYIRKKKFIDLDDEVLLQYYKKIKRVEYTSIAIAVIILFITILDIIQG